jgi:PKD domain
VIGRTFGAGVAVLSLCAGAAAAPGWRAPLPLSEPPLAVEPHLALSADGEAVVTWDREVGSVCATAPDNPSCIHVLETRSRPTAAWEGAVEIMRPGVGPGPRVAVNDGGDAIVVWRHDIGAPRVLQAAWRPRTSRQWQAPIDLSDAGPMGGQDVGLDAAGNAVAVWSIDLGGGLITQAKVRPVSSGSWLGQTTISRPGETVVGAPRLAMNAAGDAVAVWVRAPGVVQAALRPASTGAWQPASDLGPGRDPEIAVDPAGSTVAIWSVPGGGVQSAFRPAGLGWSGAADVSRAPGTAGEVALDNAGNAVAVWLGGAGPHVRSARRDRATGAWSQPVAVSAAGTAAAEPQVAVDERGNAVAVWTRGTPPTVRAALRPAGLGAWLAGVGLSAAGAAVADPLVEIDAAGRALAVWTRRAPAVSIVESAELAGTGPLLTAARIPARAAARRPVAFAVRPAAWAAPLVGAPAWRFGDGATASGQSVAHTYAARGAFTVTVNQSDAAGGVSARTAQLRIVAVLNVGRPSVAGSANAGSTLTCRKGTWRGVTPIQYAFRWRRNGRLITGARSQTFVVRQADAGALVGCSVIATNAVGSSTANAQTVRVAP